nr:MAG TPA: hypothetical protein [Caudoviricetes sp.]
MTKLYPNSISAIGGVICKKNKMKRKYNKTNIINIQERIVLHTGDQYSLAKGEITNNSILC